MYYGGLNRLDNLRGIFCATLDAYACLRTIVIISDTVKFFPYVCNMYDVGMYIFDGNTLPDKALNYNSTTANTFRVSITYIFSSHETVTRELRRVLNLRFDQK